MTKIDIITPFYCNKKEIYNFFEQIKKIYTHKFKLQVIIINDNPKIKLNNLKKYQNFKVKIINNKKNFGPAFSRNEGIEISNANYIWLLDHDIKIENKDILKRMLETLSFGSKKNTHAISGAYEIDSGVKQYLIPKIMINNISIYKKIYTSSFNIISDVYDGTSLFVYRKTFINKGFFNITLRAYEDFEWSLRSKLKFIFNNNMFVYHNEKKIFKKKINSDYFKNIILCRKFIILNYMNSKKFILPFLDLIIFPLIFLYLRIFQTYRSARFFKYSMGFGFIDYINVYKLLFTSYFIKIK
jgi:glycosyltransferase involved in cell wall biosynthesis